MIQALIVDDESLVRKGMRLVFPWDKFGVQIAGEAATGEKALEFVKRQPVQLLLTDITMPGMSGLELVKQVRRYDPSIKVVILTCHQDFEFIQEALRLGAIDYIVKTQLEELDLDETMERIMKAVRSEKPGGAAARSGAAAAGLGAGGVRAIAELAAGLQWVLDDARFAAFQEAVRDMQPAEAPELNKALAAALERWKMSLPMFDWDREPALPLAPAAAETWLLELRGRVQQWLRRSHYSEDVIAAVVKAVDLIVEQRGAHAKQGEISQSVNLSKSYFSTSFRDITRMTFTQFLQNVSVYAARDMLLLTNHPVYLIAEKCGFADQRYFSKIFKELTGLLPSEFRQRHAGRT
jgi:two-component system response regulator YesN